MESNNNFRDVLKTEILKKRPNLSPSSVKTYVSILFNINKKMNPENTDIDFFNNHDEILKLLADKPAQSRKTSLSALFVLTGNDTFNKLMLKDCQTVNKHYKEQKKSQKEEENWISSSEIKQLYDELFEMRPLC